MAPEKALCYRERLAFILLSIKDATLEFDRVPPRR